VVRKQKSLFSTGDLVSVIQIKGVETKIYADVGVRIKYKEVTIFDIPKQYIVIQYIAFAASSKSAELIIRTYNKDGTLGEQIRILSRTAAGMADLTPENLNAHKSNIWKELLYDTTNNYYKFASAFCLDFMYGVKVSLNPMDGDKAGVLAIVDFKS